MRQITRNLQHCCRCEGRLTETDRMILPNTGWCCACFEEVAVARETDLTEMRQALRRELYQMNRFWRFPWYMSAGMLLVSGIFMQNERFWEGGAYFIGALIFLVTWWRTIRRFGGKENRNYI